MGWTNNQGKESIAPYMNRRQPVSAPDQMSYLPSDLARFAYKGEATFRFGIAKASSPRPVSFMLSLNGAYNNYSSEHNGLLWIVIDEYELIGALEFNEVGDLPTDLTPPYQKGHHDGKLASGVVWDRGEVLSLALSGDRIGTYAKVISTGEYFYFNRRNHDASNPDQTWVKVKIAQPDLPATDSIADEECDIYVVRELISHLEIHPPQGYNVGYRFGLCFGGNARHENLWDACFFIDAPLTDTLFERTELNSRVAGERAIFEDEFIPISQIEAGHGIQIRYRNELGQLTGYPNYSEDPAKAFNIVIDAGEYLWALSDRLHFTTVKPDDYVIIRSSGAARFVVQQGADSALIDVPLRVSINGEPAGTDDTVEIDFQNPTPEVPEDAVEPVYFEVSDDGDAEWSETGPLQHGDYPPRTVKGVKAFVKKTSPNISENSEQINTVPTKDLNFDDVSAAPPGQSKVNWDITEETGASIRIKGSVTLDEPVKPAMRCQWSLQTPADDVGNPPAAAAICNRIDCRRAQVVSPLGVKDMTLQGLGYEHIVSKGSGAFALVVGPLAAAQDPFSGGALRANVPGRYCVSVDMHGVHVPLNPVLPANTNFAMEQQLHALKYDAELQQWMWYGHLDSFNFHQRTWIENETPPDQRSLPWSLQRSFLLNLKLGDRITFYRSMNCWPAAILDVTKNNTRYFYIRNMSFNISWHDDGLSLTVDNQPQYPMGIFPTSLQPGEWDQPINAPSKYF